MSLSRIAIVAAAAACFSAALVAQSKPTVKPSEYGQFENLSAGASQGGLSPDGKWLATAISRSSRDNELRLTRIADGTTKPAAFGSGAVFSADSKWVAYGIGVSEAETERLRRERRPVQRKLAIMNLASTDVTTIDAVESFTLDRIGAYIAMKKYAPTAATPAGGGGAGGPAPPAAPPAAGAAPAADPLGTTLILRDLASGIETSFGNIGEYAWQDRDATSLVAMTISAADKSGNGVHLYDPKTTVLRVLDSAAETYNGLTWRRDSSDLVVMRSKGDDTRDGPTQTILAWARAGEGAPQKKTFEQSADSSFPAGMRVTTFRRPSWSEDGSMIFVGLAAWDAKPAPAGRGAGRGGGAPSTEGAREGGTAPAEGAGRQGGGGPGRASGAPAEDEVAAVEVWHWNDASVMARQKLSAAADRRRNLLSVWHLDSGKFVQVAKSFDENAAPIRRTKMGYVTEWRPYAMNRSIGRPAADLSLVDLTTGARTPIKKGISDSSIQVSPGGKYLMYLENDHYWTLDLATKTATNITAKAKTSFVDRESDSTQPTRPSFGTAGWTKDDAAVVLNDRHDLWRVAADGSSATQLTMGAAGNVRHRFVRINPDEEFINLDAPGYVSLFGLLSKQSGYGKLQGGKVQRLVMLDKSVGGLAKAKNADVFVYTAQAFDDSPDAFVTGPDLASPKQITTTNPFLSKYAWGRSELVSYTTAKGVKLQGALTYPAGYEPGKKYPMVVYLYEKLSDGVHRFTPPSERDYYNGTAFTQQGYFFFQPDIVFRPREPGVSVVECVTPAVKKVVDMGIVDGTKVGVVGHSWGGFDTMYLSTHTDIFAAAVSGAGISNLISNYGNHHWSSGIAETDHIETGQQRMVVPLYEDLPAYIRNSAVFGVPTMKTPLMLMTGDQDGTVYWHQSVELYNIARRAKKNVVMLVYNGEDHGLAQKKNQVDYHRRIQQWFGHYLKGEPAPKWITEGVAFLDKDKKQ